MKAEVMAEWFRRQGYTVVRTASSYWYDAGLRVFQAFPFHWVIRPSKEELEQLLRRNGAIALRYSLMLDAPEGMASYHVACEDRGIDLSSLPRQARQNINRGLAYANFEQISVSRLAKEGWPLRQDTLARQGRSGAETQKWWDRLCMSAMDLPGFECFGATRHGELIASVLGFRCDDWFTIPYAQSSSAHLESRANNALFYSITRKAFEDPELSGVFLGIQSLDAPPSVDDFKFRMGYTAKPVRQRVVLHPYFRPFANRFICAILKSSRRYHASDYRLAKAEGIFRFYLEGRLPLTLQQWPDCLQEVKEALCGGQAAIGDGGGRAHETRNAVTGVELGKGR
jgi:hypothetical protein